MLSEFINFVIIVLKIVIGLTKKLNTNHGIHILLPCSMPSVQMLILTYAQAGPGLDDPLVSVISRSDPFN